MPTFCSPAFFCHLLSSRRSLSLGLYAHLSSYLDPTWRLFISTIYLWLLCSLPFFLWMHGVSLIITGSVYFGYRGFVGCRRQLGYKPCFQVFALSAKIRDTSHADPSMRQAVGRRTGKSGFRFIKSGEPRKPSQIQTQIYPDHDLDAR
jgi:hypothetical protein